MRRRWVRLASLLALFAIGGVVDTWPLALHLRDAWVDTWVVPPTFGLQDNDLTAWILAWDAHALLRSPFHLFDANIFYPLRGTLAFSEHMLGAAVLTLPVDLAFRDPVLDRNLLVLASFALMGTGTTMLLRELGAGTAAALVGGAIAAFGPVRIAYLDHVQALASHWMPFAWLFLHRVLRTARWTDGVAFAVCFALQALTSVYHAYYFGVAVGALLVLHRVWRFPAVRGALPRVATALLIAVLLTAPAYLPYRALRERLSLGRNPSQVVTFAAHGDTYLGAVTDPMGWLRSRGQTTGLPYPAAVGLGTAALGLLAVAIGAGPTRDRRRPALLYLSVATCMAVVSLGPTMRMRFFAPGIPGPYPLFSVLPGWDALRAPLRAVLPAVLALAVLAGLGADAVLSRLRGPRARAVVVVALAALVVAECWRPQLTVWKERRTPRATAAHEWVATHAPGVPLVELPIGDIALEATYMVLSSRHWNPLLNGYSGFAPYGDYFARAFAFPDEPSLRLLHDLGVGLVVVHDDLLRRPLCALLATRPSPYLQHVRIDPLTCVERIVGAPAAPPAPPERRVSLAGVRASGSDDTPATAAVDGDPTTHWTQPVLGGARDAWIQLDLPEPHDIRRIRLRLGPHFGDYLRVYRIDASADGVHWAPRTPVQLAEPPLRSYRENPDDLWIDLPVPPAATAHLRIVRPQARGAPGAAFVDWMQWGVHEVELYEADAGA